MIVMHVENEPIWREAFQRQLGVQGGRLGSCDYLATGFVDEAEKRLQAGSIRAMVLDIGLNVDWDNRHMIAVLRNLTLDEVLANPSHSMQCHAHRLSRLAHAQGVPAVLLTNYADYTGGDPPLTRERLQEIFQVEAVFGKDEKDMHQCATWLRRILELQ